MTYFPPDPYTFVKTPGPVMYLPPDPYYYITSLHPSIASRQYILHYLLTTSPRWLVSVPLQV